MLVNIVVLQLFMASTCHDGNGNPITKSNFCGEKNIMGTTFSGAQHDHVTFECENRLVVPTLTLCYIFSLSL